MQMVVHIAQNILEPEYRIHLIVVIAVVAVLLCCFVGFCCCCYHKKCCCKKKVSSEWRPDSAGNATDVEMEAKTKADPNKIGKITPAGFDTQQGKSMQKESKAEH